MIAGPNFVYLCIPRTASHALEDHLLPALGGIPICPQNYHARIVPAEHNRKFTFVTIRNPYDRMASLYRYCLRFIAPEAEVGDIGVRLDLGSPALFVESCARLQEETADPASADSRWLNQTRFLAPARMDGSVRFESLVEDLINLPCWDTVQLREMLARQSAGELFPVANASLSRTIGLDYGPLFLKAVERHSGPDFEKFGYPRFSYQYPIDSVD